MSDLPAKRGPRPRDPAFAAAWTLMRNALRFQDGVDPGEQLAAYRIALEDLPSEDILEAAKRIVRRETFMPVPAKIREEVADVQADRNRAGAAKPSAPHPGKTQREILDLAQAITTRTMETHADHVDRLVEKAAGKLERAEVLWRIRTVLEQPAYDAACRAVLGNGNHNALVTFEAYNQQILADLASWARLPITNALRPGASTDRLAAPVRRPASQIEASEPMSEPAET